MTTTHVLVVDDDTLLREFTATVLRGAGFQVSTANGGHAALDQIATNRPEIVLLDVQMPGMDGIEVCRQIRRNPAYAQMPVVLLTAGNSLDERVRGFDAGADDFVAKPYDPTELQVRIRALLRRVATPETSVPAAPPPPKAHTVAVFSLRGGAGVSTVAANLATSLARLWGHTVGLIDLALPSGQSALMLNLPPRHSWADIVGVSLDEVDSAFLEGVMLHHASGVAVLAAPARPEQSELLTAAHVTHTLGLAREHFTYLVIELAHDFSELTLAGLDQADLVLVLLTPDLAALRATACALDVFASLDYPHERQLITLVQNIERRGLGRNEIEASLHRPIDWIIPYSAEPVTVGINTGVPLVLSAPTLPISACLEDLSWKLSREEDRKERPAQPSEAWVRLVRRHQSMRGRS